MTHDEIQKALKHCRNLTETLIKLDSDSGDAKAINTVIDAFVPAGIAYDNVIHGQNNTMSKPMGNFSVEHTKQAFDALKKYINHSDDVFSKIATIQSPADIQCLAIDARNSARLVLLETLGAYEELRTAYLDEKEKQHEKR